MHYLVTGGAGFIGSHLCERLIQDSHSLVCLDNFNDFYDPEIKRHNIQSLIPHPQFQLVQGDILDWPLLQTLFDNHAYALIRKGFVNFL